MSETPDEPGGQGSSDVSRRSVLKKGALVGGAAFMIPAVQTISMSRASAQNASGGGGGGGIGGGGGYGWGGWGNGGDHGPHHHRPH